MTAARERFNQRRQLAAEALSNVNNVDDFIALCSVDEIGRAIVIDMGKGAEPIVTDVIRSFDVQNIQVFEAGAYDNGFVFRDGTSCIDGPDGFCKTMAIEGSHEQQSVFVK